MSQSKQRGKNGSSSFLAFSPNREHPNQSSQSLNDSSTYGKGKGD
jgi:hypothetical protein